MGPPTMHTQPSTGCQRQPKILQAESKPAPSAPAAAASATLVR